MSVEVHVVLNGEDHNKTQVFWIAVPKEYEKQSPHKYNIRELKQGRFWGTYVNRKWDLSLFICLDTNKFVLLSFSSLIKTIYLRVWTNPLPNDAKSPFPVDVRRSKTLLLISSLITLASPLGSAGLKVKNPSPPQ